MNHTRPALSRRSWLKLSTVGAVSFGAGASPWMRSLADDAAASPERHRSCILLWMAGGPSQMETLDPKPGQENGGPTKAIATAADGVQISEHLPQLAKQMQEVALVRSLKTREGDHQRATFLAHTGRVPQGPIAYPSMGAVAAKELGGPQDMPHFVSISPALFFGNGAYSSGFLGPDYAPLIVGNGFGAVPSPDAAGALGVRNLKAHVGDSQFDQRWGLLGELQDEFAAERPDLPVNSHRSAYERALQMMRGRAAGIFDLSQENDKLRDAYGQNNFGQGCLLARRLVEAGVSFVEVALNGWDTHTNNFDQTANLCQTLDPAWAALLKDLKTRGLLESTMVVWMGEFGRTPRINGSNGRDHYPNAWSAAFAGGGIRGGQVIGRTSDNGETVEDRPVSIPQLLATLCCGLGMDPKKQNMSNVGRPIRLVDPDAEAVSEVLL